LHKLFKYLKNRLAKYETAKNSSNSSVSPSKDEIRPIRKSLHEKSGHNSCGHETSGSFTSNAKSCVSYENNIENLITPAYEMIKTD
jgi:hypothetical protein